jgi:MFS family permease
MTAFSLNEPLLALRTVLAAVPLRRSLLAYLLFNTAEWAIWVAVLVFAYDYGGTTASAIAAVAQLLPAAIVAPLATSLADGAPRERLLSWTYLLQAGMMALTVVLFMLDAPPLLILLGAVLVSVSISLSRPIYLAALPAFAGNTAQLTAANSVSTMAESLAVLAGPAIAAAVTRAQARGRSSPCSRSASSLLPCSCAGRPMHSLTWLSPHVRGSGCRMRRTPSRNCARIPADCC